jgi:hypothetical protein
MIKTLSLLAFIACLAGCSDTTIARISAIGSAGHVTCYSGGHVIYDGNSTGKIENAHASDGYEFKDAATGRLVRVSGDCLVTN